MTKVALRRYLQPREETGRSDLQVLSVYRDHGVVPKDSRTDNFNRTPEDVTRYQRVLPDDLVVNKMKAWSGSVAVSRHEGIVSGDYLVCQIMRLTPGYLHYVLRSQEFVGEMRNRSTGIRPSQERLYWEDLADIRVDAPPESEQRRIADFLDDRVGRIDRIIAARRDQAGRVAEASNSAIDLIISEAMSHGAAALRRYCAGIEQGSSPISDDRPASMGEAGVLKTSAVALGQFHPAQNKVVDKTLVDRHNLCRNGDVVITRGSGSAELVGDAAVVSLDPTSGALYLSDLTYRLRYPTADPAFIVLGLTCPSGRSQLRALVRQGSGPAKARGDDILSVLIPTISPTLQRSLVAEAQRVRDEARYARSALERSIDLLTEYKSSLVTAAVTGEIDVTASGSRIPA